MRVDYPVPRSKQVGDGRAGPQERVIAARREVRDGLREAAHEVVQSGGASKAGHACCQVLQHLQKGGCMGVRVEQGMDSSSPWSRAKASMLQHVHAGA